MGVRCIKQRPNKHHIIPFWYNIILRITAHTMLAESTKMKTATMSPSIPVSSHLAPSLPGSGQEAHCTCDHVTRTGAKPNPVWRKVSHARKIRSCEGQQTVGWTMQLVIYIVSNNKSVQISIIKFWRVWLHKRSDTCQVMWPCGVWGLGWAWRLSL